VIHALPAFALLLFYSPSSRCRNSTLDLSRAELHFLQSIRDDSFPFPSPPVTSQMALELLTPVSGLERLKVCAESVHFFGSIGGSFHILAHISNRTRVPLNLTEIYSYEFKIPELQREARPRPPKPDFLSDWLPQHSSFIEIQTVESTGQNIVTKYPHGLRVGDFVRFRDASSPLHNLGPFQVSFVNDIDKFQTTPAAPSLKAGLFVHLQQRFFPLQKLEQISTLLSKADSSVKCLIVSQSLPRGLRSAAWTEIDSRTSRETLCFWSGNATPPIRKGFDDPHTRARVECACFLTVAHGTFIALGCTDVTDGSCLFIWEPLEGRLCIVKNSEPLPALTRLTLLPADDDVAGEPNHSVGHVLVPLSFVF
jgi:hypothetical protein